MIAINMACIECGYAFTILDDIEPLFCPQCGSDELAFWLPEFNLEPAD